MYFTCIIFEINCIQKPVNQQYCLLILVLTITIRANIVVPSGVIHSYYQTMVTKICCAPGLIDCPPALKYLVIIFAFLHLEVSQLARLYT